MKGFAVFGGLAVVGIGFLGNAYGTGTCLVTIITIRGVAFLVRKMTWSLSKEMADILDFTAWCACAVPFVSIIKNAQLGLAPVTTVFTGINSACSGIASFFSGVINNIDKLNKLVDKFRIMQ